MGHLHHVPFESDDPIPYTDPSVHHHITDAWWHPQDVLTYSKQYPQDPVTKVSFTIPFFLTC